MKTVLIIIATLLVSAVIFIPIGVLIRKKIAESKIRSAEFEAQNLIDKAKVEIENMKKEEIIRSKEEVLRIRNELDQEIKERREKINTKRRKSRKKSFSVWK